MKKFLIETTFVLIYLGISILIFYRYLDKHEWQLALQHEGLWSVIKPVAKWIVALTILLSFIGSGIRAIIAAIIKNKRKNNQLHGNGK
jgi:hypothetical protein